jgi:hypothetical protein
MKIYPVFYVSLFELLAEDPLLNQVISPPPLIEVEGEEEFWVREILDSRIRGKKRQFLVSWVGYNTPTWEPLENISETEAYSKYLARYPY